MNKKLNVKQSISAGLLAGVVSAVINATLFFVFHAVGVLSDNVLVQPNQPLTIVPVLISSLLPSLIGSLVFFMLEKFTSNGYRLFTILSVVLVVLSLYTPFAMPVNATTGYALVLCLMHLTVAFSLIYFIGKRIQKQATTSRGLF